MIDGQSLQDAAKRRSDYADAMNGQTQEQVALKLLLNGQAVILLRLAALRASDKPGEA